MNLRFSALLISGLEVSQLIGTNVVEAFRARRGEAVREGPRSAELNVGALAKFKGEYARRMAADKGDCEARVLHAFTVLAELAENKEFTASLAGFGSTFDYLHCRFEGEGKFDSMSPAMI